MLINKMYIIQLGYMAQMAVWIVPLTIPNMQQGFTLQPGSTHNKRQRRWKKLTRCSLHKHLHYFWSRR